MTKQERLEKDIQNLKEMRAYEDELHERGVNLIAGIDEVGRGPLAGPVYAACVVLPTGFDVLGINDSKKVSEKKRIALDKEIREKAVTYGIGIATPAEIDGINILNATKLAMMRAIDDASSKLPEGQNIERILIDAVKLDTEIPCESFIKGDARILSIAAASIVAKVARDSYMVEMEDVYPGYAFASNKGYGTKAHYEGLMELGMTPIHRRTFIKESQVAKKVYAVKVGRQPGIYSTWEDCKAQVDGFSGAQYKGFTSKIEAENYLRGTEDDIFGENKQVNSTAIENTAEKKDVAEAYVDGSYDVANHRYAAGGVILYNGNEYEFSEAYDGDCADLRNVAGEIMGARLAIEYCIKNEIKDLVIYHDYMGVGMWGDDKWKANLDMTKAYKEFVKEARKQLDIRFVKVKAHSGNRYNEIADKLAKSALGI